MGAAVVKVMLSLWKLCCTKTIKSETNSIGMALIEIPAGKFTMGSPWGEENRFDDREEQVEVTLTHPFMLGKTEVTQGQWKQVMGTEPWNGQNNVLADNDCPATYVSWDDATKFCGKLTDLERKAGKLKGNEEYRLPTEAEWEYACRAGTTTAYSFYDQTKLDAHAWWGLLDLEAMKCDHSQALVVVEQSAYKVGLKKPNQWGLHDMHGNAWEWCSDWYGGDLPGGTDPIGPKGGSSRVDRGGCWWGSRNYRNGVVPSFRGRNLGFRVVRSQSRPVQLETNSIGMALIEIPAGKFTMGSPWGEENRFDDREEQVEVTLTHPFMLGKTEVTQGQWKQVMGTEPWNGQNNVLADNDCPATYVSWDDATKFCGKLTDLERKAGKLKGNEEYRLPTEAEWEYACRAGTTTAFSFGDESKLNAHAWWGGLDLEAMKAGEIKAGPGNASHEQYSHKVGLKRPNPWGLYDMHGNVWEWCSDWYGKKLLGGADPVGSEAGSARVGRGGSWWSAPSLCRSALRSGDVPSFRNNYLGFRVARSQSETRAERPVQLKTNSTGMALIEIPAGKFMMGSPAWERDRRAGEKQVAVTLRAFMLGKTEVTQGQWKQVMGTEPWNGQNNVLADNDCPATLVSFFDAVEFCKKLTDLERKAGKLKAHEKYRLPTEAEREYACRAGTTTDAWGGLLDFEAIKAVKCEAGPGNAFHEQYPHKVGLKKRNRWGLYGMHGNVGEWCSDWYSEKLLDGTDPVGSVGGSGGPSRRFFCVGFRVARSQSETNSIGMELIEIPAGKFTMGSPADEKDRQPNEEQVAVTLTKPFALGKTEVTQWQWTQVMGTEPWEGEDYIQADNDCPATLVSFFDAVEFCDRLTYLERNAGRLKDSEEYRLPTEAEWEYACRAGTTTAFSFGDESESQLNAHAWWGGDLESMKAVKYEEYPHKVGLKKPNQWGLHDMQGNVGEWCSDWYGGDLPGGTDPIGPKGGSSRVNRGDSWRYYPGRCRSAFRDWDDPSLRFFCIGFRVARSESETNSIGTAPVPRAAAVRIR